ncbi:hypothetical protein NHH03_07305 [Stieleria sp. TO1_6]|nr:hypothetical protein [Stieleria tagensis]
MLALVFASGLLAYAAVETKRWLDPYDGLHFDPVIWKADPGGDQRAAMCADIIGRQLTPGMTLSSISDLLGDSYEQRDRSHFVDGDQMPGVRTVSYWVGPCSWIGYDDAFLFLNLDAEDRLVSATVYGY